MSDDFWKQIEENRKRHLSDAKELRSHDLWSFWKEAQRQIAAQYERVQHRASIHPNTAGDQGETDWKVLLEDWLPPAYKIVTRGRLLYTNGSTSPELDLIVLKPGYPPAMLTHKYYLADGVAAVFECKRTLQASHIDEAVATANGIQSNLITRSGDPRRELFGPIVTGLLAHTHSWTKPNSTPLVNIEEQLERTSEALVHEPRNLIDILCVGDLCSWNVWKQTGFQFQVTAGWGRSAASQEDETARQVVQSAADGMGSIEALDMLIRKDPRQMVGILQSVVMHPGVFAGEELSPVGYFVCAILEKLAWEDPAIRPTATLFRKFRETFSNTKAAWGYWNYGGFSEEVRERLLVNSTPTPLDAEWDPWKL